MKFKNGDIFMAMSGQESPFSKLIDQKFPVKVSYNLAKMVKKLDDQFKVMESVRDGLIKKYGEQSEGKMEVDPKGENWPKFVAEFNELMEQEVEIVIDKVKIPSKINDKDIEIEPSLMLVLEKFIEVE